MLIPSVIVDLIVVSTLFLVSEDATKVPFFSCSIHFESSSMSTAPLPSSSTRRNKKRKSLLESIRLVTFPSFRTAFENSSNCNRPQLFRS